MWKKGLLAGFLILIVGLGLNWIIGMLIPEVQNEYQNTSIFRPWQDPLMLVYFAYPFVLAVALSFLWDKIKAKNALEFAKLFFIVATVPGMFITYTSMQISLLMIIVWSVVGFIEAYIAGLVFTRLK